MESIDARIGDLQVKNVSVRDEAVLAERGLLFPVRLAGTPTDRSVKDCPADGRR